MFYFNVVPSCTKAGTGVSKIESKQENSVIVMKPLTIMGIFATLA